MTQANSTRDQIIDQAFQLMLQRGLHGFSYRDIAEPMGVKNAAIHYHFPNKMDLIKALIDENHQVLRRSTSEFMAYGGPAMPQLEGLFAYAMNQCQCGRPICMVGALAIDYDELNDDIKSANDRQSDGNRPGAGRISFQRRTNVQGYIHPGHDPGRAANGPRSWSGLPGENFRPNPY